MELDKYRPVLATVPSVELGIYCYFSQCGARYIMASVPSVELDKYWPVLATVPSVELGIYCYCSQRGARYILANIGQFSGWS